MANVMKSARDDAPALYMRAMDGAVAIVSAIRPDQWHNATPCAEWDLRVLVNHVTGENLWIEQILGGKTIADVGTSLDGDLLGDDPIKAYVDSVARAKASLLPERYDLHYGVSLGDISGYDYLSQMFMDQLVHSWDIAKGSGQNAVFDDALVVAATPIAEEMVGYVGPGSVFGTRVTTDTGASSLDVLLGVLGRKGDWKPPTGATFV